MKTHQPLLAFVVSALLTGTALAAPPKDPVVFTHLIAPIFEAKCTKCHGEEKDKGDLRLDSYAAVIKGGDEAEGENIVPGDTEKSYLIGRIGLPIDDDEHMPPEDEEQLTKGEIQLIEWWIKSGAKEDVKLAAANPPQELEAIIKEVLNRKPEAAGKEEKKVLTAEEQKAQEEKSKIAAAAMESINATGATLMPIAADTPALRFTALNVSDEFGDEQLALLKPVGDQIQWLDIAGTKVTDQGLVQVAAMTGLTRLHLQNTGVGDTGLDHLRGLENLEYLNLYGTGVSDAGLAKLESLKNLRKLFVWQSKATEDGAKALEGKIPGLAVNIGWLAKDDAVVVASAEKAAAPDAKPEVAKPDAKPQPKAAAKPAPKPEDPLAAAVAEAKRVAGEAQKAAEAAQKAAAEAKKVADDLEKKQAEAAQAAAAKAKAAAAKKSGAAEKKPAAAEKKPAATTKPAVKPAPAKTEQEQKPKPKPATEQEKKPAAAQPQPKKP